MKLTSEELKSLYQEGTSRTATARAGCLTAEILMQAGNGKLSKSERERVADHLGSCSDCAQEFRLARELKLWAEETGEMMAASANPALNSDATAQSVPLRVLGDVAPRRPVRWRRFFSAWSPARLVSAFAVQSLILLALGGWLLVVRQDRSSQIARLNEQLAERDRSLDGAHRSLDEARRRLEESKSEATAKPYEEEIAKLRREVAELSGPQLGMPIIDLDPGGTVRGEPAGAASTIEIPETANSVTLILNFTDQQTHSSYEVEIFNQRGQRIWRGQSTSKGPASSLNVTLARSLVSDGRYGIKLFGLRDGKKEPIAEYSVTIK